MKRSGDLAQLAFFLASHSFFAQLAFLTKLGGPLHEALQLIWSYAGERVLHRLFKVVLGCSENRRLGFFHSTKLNKSHSYHCNHRRSQLFIREATLGQIVEPHAQRSTSTARRFAVRTIRRARRELHVAVRARRVVFAWSQVLSASVQSRLVIALHGTI